MHVATIFVPGAADRTTAALTWGVLAFSGLAIAVFTSSPKLLFRRRSWRAVHLSVPATALACVHAYQLGSDAHTFAFRVLMPLAVGGTVSALGVRIWSAALSKSQRTPTKS